MAGVAPAKQPTALFAESREGAERNLPGGQGLASRESTCLLLPEKY